MVLSALLFTATSLLAITPATRPTGVGSGDVADILLATVRLSLKETLAQLQQEGNLDSVCDCRLNSKHFTCMILKTLTGPQREFCKTFLTNAIDPMLKMNEGEDQTPFTLSKQPFAVLDPYGKPQIGIAMTNLGPTGPISFHRQGILALFPAELLYLMGHEFGHKVEFGGAEKYVEDNPAIGPFNFLGGGRYLLNTLGAALSRYAMKHELIGQYFGVDDKYACKITETNSGMTFSSQGASPRLFLNESLGRYESTVGRLPQDFNCYFSSDGGVSNVHFKSQIHEELGCGATPKLPQERWTRIELWKTITSKPGTLTPPPTKLEARTVTGWNPHCADPQKPEPMKLETSTAKGHFVIEVAYEGTIGKTSAIKQGR